MPLTDKFAVIFHATFTLPSSSRSGAIVLPSTAWITIWINSANPCVEPVVPWTILASTGSTMGVQGWEETCQKGITVWISGSWSRHTARHTAQHDTQGHKTQESWRRHFNGTCNCCRCKLQCSIHLFIEKVAVGDSMQGGSWPELCMLGIAWNESLHSLISTITYMY